MLAEIINIGDELLIGQVINTNASWMSAQLNSIGIDVNKISIISDKKNDILSCIDEAFNSSDIIFITGGLGPTNDDITKFTLCEYFKSELIFDTDTYNRIEALFAKRGFKVSELNRKQAEVPHNCRVIPNNNGTASGMWFEKKGKILISLPGVPFEMKAMISDFILPELKQNIDYQIIHKTVNIQGIGESFLADLIKEWENNLPDEIHLAYLPQPGIIRLRLSAKGSKTLNLNTLINFEIEKLQNLIPDLIFGFDEDTLESVIAKLLIKNKKTLSTAESCTGGYISHLITSIQGSSNYYKGSIISYSNEAKINLLDVNNETLIKYGAVSKETVIEMAVGALKRLNTDYAIAVSGIAGPDGGTIDKVVGTIWVAIASKDKIITEKFLHGENRERNIRKAALSSLNMLRKFIQAEC